MASPKAEHMVILALMVVGAWGCASNKIVGRYKSAVCKTANEKETSCSSVVPTAAAYAVSIKTPESAETSGTSFPERALAEYVDVLGNPRYSPTAKDLRSNLATKLKEPHPSSEVENRTVFHRTLVVTVAKEGGFNPADRLEMTDVTIRLGNACFDNWDAVATAYTMISAGTVQLTQARQLTESVTASPPSTSPVSAGATVTGSQSNTKVENYSASIQAETLTVSVEQKGRSLVIHRQGGINVDLTGNAVIKVTISYTPDEDDDGCEKTNSGLFNYLFTVDEFKDKKGKWIAPDKLKIARQPVWAVPPGTSIWADVSLRYTLRHVIQGGETYEEKDDQIIEYTANGISHRVGLIPIREASPLWFGLVGDNGQGFALNIKNPETDAVGLCFDTYDSAREFLGYLKAANAMRPWKLGDSRLGFVEPPNGLVDLTSANLAELQTQAKCF
jgi:hypothetical protein